jgi:D-alanyl-D-alanine carboxypeptidase/D-alanyl-D-alanine-endopeptidase (penicillin-binding protein 4)
MQLLGKKYRILKQGAAMRVLAKIITLGISALLGTTTAYATTQTINGINQLNNSINHALQKVSPYSKIGISIKSMKYGDALYNRNEKTLFVPASTLKVLTAEAALLFLGPQYTFKTRIVTDARNSDNSTLHGNIYLINSGDPTLTYADLADLVNALRARGIRSISGNVFIDNSAYDAVTTGPGWLWNDKRFCYAAPISASIINHNCLSFRVNPASRSGSTAHVVTDPHTYYANIQNSVVTRSHASRTCYVRVDGARGGTIAISGCLAKGHSGAGVSSVINDVVQYNKSLLNDLMLRNGIEVQGTIEEGNVSSPTTELARHDSKPLHDLINDMLKMSDNIIAGSIFKKIGEEYYHRPGTWENGATAVEKILAQHASVDIWRMSLIDGSGLSRYNQVTPAQMLKVLEFTFHNHATNMAFVSALPVAGVDGTLKRRMHNIAWRVRAKTGTMQGVVSLAGYAMSADKEPIAFVIMINSKYGSVWQYRQLEDRIMQSLTHYSRYQG